MRIRFTQVRIRIKQVRIKIKQVGIKITVARIRITLVRIRIKSVGARIALSTFSTELFESMDDLILNYDILFPGENTWRGDSCRGRRRSLPWRQPGTAGVQRDALLRSPGRQHSAAHFKHPDCCGNYNHNDDDDN